MVSGQKGQKAVPICLKIISRASFYVRQMGFVKKVKYKGKDKRPYSINRYRQKRMPVITADELIRITEVPG